jgi:hypothetical protein
VVALLILLLILLPLYLWPLRGSGTGLPGAAALSRPPRDPRDAAAIAHLPADVWEALMGEGPSGRHVESSPKAPGNLTRIAELDDDIGAGDGSLQPRYDGLYRGHGITGLFGDGSDQSNGQSGGRGDSPPASVQFLAGPTSGESASSGNGWGGGGSSGLLGNPGPFTGGGGPGGRGGFAPPTFFSDAGDPGAPAPTPEPSTILLVGSNLALLGAAAWRRLRGGKEQSSG